MTSSRSRTARGRAGGRSGPASRVRNAVAMPSGPLTAAGAPRQPPPPSAPPPLAQAIARAPHVIEMMPLSGSGGNGGRVSPVAPTQIAPPLQLPPPGPGVTAPNMTSPTMAMPPAMQASQPMWAATTAATGGTVPPPQMPQMQMPMPPGLAQTMPPGLAQTMPPGLAQTMPPGLAQTMPPQQMMPMPPMSPTPPPNLFGQLDSGVVQSMATATPAEGTRSDTRDPARGGRRPRSKLSIIIWIVVGAAVIGGGVFAGFQIRAMRLDKQIEVAREHATEQAKADTWLGWTAARDSLAGIVQASASIDNRAALARVKALMAYEFGDGVGDAKTAVESLQGAPGRDADVAAAYLALAFDDVKTAKQHADAAVAEAGSDGEALYVSALAQVLGGDYAGGIPALQKAVEADPRSLPVASLARAYADIGAWDAALAALDKGLKDFPDNPALIIVRSRILAQAGRVVPGVASADVRAALEHVVTEGGKAVADQTRGVSPAQLAFATLAQIRIEYARANQGAENAAMRQLVAVAIDDQRFAEETIDTLVAVGEPASAKSAADRALAIWPQSRRATIALAQIQLAAGQAAQALDTLKKVADATTLPIGLVTRAEARLACGDLDGARADFDAALKRLPTSSARCVGSVALDLEGGDVDGARKLVERRSRPRRRRRPRSRSRSPRSCARSATPPRSTRRRRCSRSVVKASAGPDVARAQLELARIYRDLGDLRGARDMYAEASHAGNFDARSRARCSPIEDRDPNGGRDTLDAAGQGSRREHAARSLLLEIARARMLVGDHDGADALLAAAEQRCPRPSRSGSSIASAAASRCAAATCRRRPPRSISALDGCGSDAETFLLAADMWRPTTRSRKTRRRRRASRRSRSACARRPRRGWTAGPRRRSCSACSRSVATTRRRRPPRSPPRTSRSPKKAPPRRRRACYSASRWSRIATTTRPRHARRLELRDHRRPVDLRRVPLPGRPREGQQGGGRAGARVARRPRSSSTRRACTAGTTSASSRKKADQDKLSATRSRG